MASHSYDFDYLVLGGGSGGVSTAKRAALLYNKKVAVVEGGRWGGTCVNVGCVPKKIMFQTSNLWETLRHDATEYEIKANGQPTFDFKALKEKRDKYILRLNGIYENGLKKAGVELIQGWGSFVDPHTVQVAMGNGSGTKIFTAQHIVIVVGGRPVIAPGDGIKDYSITSNGFFDLTELPKKAVVVGAGYIAVELAGVLNGLGTDTHLVVRKEKALREFDPDVSNMLDEVMQKNGMTIHRNTGGVAKIELEADGKKKKVTCIDGSTIIDGADVVLMAPGREPLLEGLGLEKAGVQLDDRSKYIKVDEYQNTSVKGIYALGDVCGNMELTPMAIAAGRRLADRLFSGKPEMVKAKASYENVPTVVFSHPPIGSIGLTEPKAVQKYGKDNLKIYKSTFVNLHYSMFSSMEPSQKPKTMVKLICSGVEELVVGLHVVGMGADEMLQGFGVAMKMGATKADFDACVAIHPTAAEEVVTLGDWGTSPQYTGAKISPLMGAPAGKPTPKSKM